MNIIETILNSSTLASILGEYVIGKSLDSILNFKKELTKKYNVEIDIDLEDTETEDAILTHLKNSVKWSKSLSIHMFNVKHRTEFVYVDLGVKNYTKLSALEPHELQDEPVPFSHINNTTEENLCVLANPGSGKTSLLKKHCLNLIENISEGSPIPIALPLRDIEKQITSKDLFLTEYILREFDISVAFKSKSLDDGYETKVLMDVAIQFLNEWNIILILDGFDEVSDFHKRVSLYNELNYYSEKKESFKIILSSRYGESLPKNDNFLTFELASLSEDQIKHFIDHYLNSKKEVKKKFYKLLIDSSFAETTKTPLLLTFYCIYYNYYGFLPTQPSAIYSKITTLFIEEWSKLNSVKRISKFSNFDFNIKEKFLREIAFQLTGNLNFDFGTFDKIFNSIKKKYKLENENAKEVLEEIQSHNGLIVPYFSNRYSFIHKTIQEYLAAEFLLRQGTLPKRIEYLPNELAVLLGILDDPNNHFYEICLENREILNFQFASTFLARLSIEKPMFTPTATLGLSLISLYNQAKRIDQKEKKPSYKLYSDTAILDFVGEFENFTNHSVYKESLSMLSEHYEKKGKHVEYQNTLIALKERDSNPIYTKHKKPKRIFVNGVIYRRMYAS